MTQLLISEVAPRDGLQSVKSIMATADKCRWIQALADAGLKEIEVASFVPAKLLPQMADAAEVVRFSRTITGLHVAALAPNLKGAQAAFEAGAHKLTMPVSVSAAHLWANVRKTHEQVVEEVRQVVALRDARYPGVEIEAGLSTAFGCTISGAVSDDEVMRLSLQMAQLGVDEVGLSDTSGYANPAQIRRLFLRLQSELGSKAGGAHLHNTMGLGLANVVAALEVGVTTFDSSQAGIGGCPYAPGASGNIVTEDLVYMLDSMGYDTGIDLRKLAAARAILAAAMPAETLYGYTAAAGLPKDYRQNDAQPVER
jgi:hydroxymethylglutaryl-CoA lyase